MFLSFLCCDTLRFCGLCFAVSALWGAGGMQAIPEKPRYEGFMTNITFVCYVCEDQIDHEYTLITQVGSTSMCMDTFY